MRVPALLFTAALLLGACSGDDSGGSGGKADSPAVQPADEGIPGVLAIKVASANHVQGEVTYDRHPPVGGDHNPIPLKCGFYNQVVPDEFVVHSMEHGAVWLAYRADLPAADIEVIHNLARNNAEVVATPYPNLDAGVAVVASAWARQLSLTSVSDPRLAKFVEVYQNGKQAPEASILCANSPLGDPIP